MDPHNSPIEPAHASDNQWQEDMDHPDPFVSPRKDGNRQVLEHQQERPVPSRSMSFAAASTMPLSTFRLSEQQPSQRQQQLASVRSPPSISSSSSSSSSSSVMASTASSDPLELRMSVSTPVVSSIAPPQLMSSSSLSSFNRIHDNADFRKRRQYDSRDSESVSNISVAKSRHFYSSEQDEFLANKLSKSPMLLQNSRERGQAVPSKERLHQEIATELNQRFNASVDGPQIKNKIAHMRKLWCAAHDMMSRIDPDDAASRRKVLSKCSFYHILESISDILLSTGSRKVMDDSNNADDNVETPPSETDDDVLEQHSNINDTAPGLGEPGPSSKRWGNEHEREGERERNTKRSKSSGPNVTNFLTDIEKAVQQQQQRQQQWMTSHERYRAECDIEVKRGQIALLMETEATKRAEMRLEYDLLINKARVRQLELELELERERVKRLTLERG